MFSESKKRKKPYTSKTYTTGNPGLNMAQFNKNFNKVSGAFGDGSYMNGTIDPGGSSGDSGAGDGGGMGESFGVNAGLDKILQEAYDYLLTLNKR